MGESRSGSARDRNIMTEEQEPPPVLKQILVAYSAVESLERGETHDLDAELETLETARGIAEQLNIGGLAAQTYEVHDLDDIDDISSNFDLDHTLIFNLCEHLYGDSRHERTVVQRMVDRKLLFTGASLNTLVNCLDKGITKEQLKKAGVPTPKYQIFRRADAAINIPFPAFVKPIAEDASIGIDRASVVHDEASLRSRVQYILDTYHEAALVEEFIDGREFNVSMWGNGTVFTLPIGELDYCDWQDPYQRFLHFDAKWTPQCLEYQTMYVRCPADVDDQLAKKLNETAMRAYQALACRDYARIDMRLHDGEPIVLEVNPNPCLASDAGFPLAARTAGYDYPTMVGRIARWAWMRERCDG